MLGAIAGDIIGSTFEGRPIKTTQFPLFAPHSVFTDDTVLTVAVADVVLNDMDYAVVLRSYANRYPNAGYGNSFYKWMLSDEDGPYNSWGNGSAMRVSPIGFAFDTESEVLAEALRSAEVTHNHPEGIKGAQATALAVFLGRTTHDKALIREEISKRFDYDLNRSLDDIRATYQFDLSCQGSVPESIIAFLESDDVEDAIRKAISLGGDSDTMASIAGGIAQAYYDEVPADIIDELRGRLPTGFISVIDRFNQHYNITSALPTKRRKQDG